MLTLLSALVALGCVLASARRLGWVVAPTGLDARMLFEATSTGQVPWRTLRDRLGSGPDDVAWERELLAAHDEADVAARDAVADEQLLEVRWRLRRWDRVPRVCASISTSAGFLFASIALLQGLASPVEGAVSAKAALFSALTPLTLGLAGTSFCVAVYVRARRAVRSRLTDYERLVDAVRTERTGLGSERTPDRS